MKKTIFALKGVSNSGKSSTIKMVYNLLKKKYPVFKIPFPLENKNILNGKIVNPEHDFRIIIDINKIRVGIESQGDPNSRLFESLELFDNKKCQIIVCATRSRGTTYVAVNELASSFSVNWIEMNKFLVEDLDKINTRNHKVSKMLLNEISILIQNSK